MVNFDKSASSSPVDSFRPELFLQVPGVLFCLVDEHGVLVGASISWEEVLGYSQDELKSINLLSLVHPDDLERTLGDIPWIDRPSSQDGYTNRCRHKDGSYRWLRWHTQRRHEMQLTYAIGIDITNSTDAAGKKPLVSPRAKASDQILFEANPNPMWVTDRETLRFLEVNDAAIKHYGYTRDEFLSMTLLDIRPPEDKEALIESVRRDPADKEPRVWTHICKNGQRIKIEVQVRNIPYLGYHARISTIKDVTEQERSKAQLLHVNELLEQRVIERTQQLLAANKELEAFCFSISHDLRAPLRAIDGFSHAILHSEKCHLSSEARQDLDRVRKASQRMSELIDTLLGLARLSRQELVLQKVNLSALAMQVNGELRLENRGRDVKCRIQEGMEAIADVRLTQLLLQILFSNAWKFTANEPQAEIVFETQETNGEISFAIRDNGAGFDMAYADKLFQPFQRLHHVSEFPGNGVGLATAHRIVTRHGGRLIARGVVHQGATITFTLGKVSKDEIRA